MGFLGSPVCGNGACGSKLPISGAIRNLRVILDNWDTAELAFIHQCDFPSTFELGLVVNGELRLRMASTARNAAASQLRDGSHSLNVIPHVLGEPWGELHGELLGQRAYVSWDPDDDTTIASYQLWWNGGDGGAVDTLLAEVSQMEVERRINSRPDTGTGRGRIDVAGNYPGGLDPINEILTLSITAAGEYTYDFQGESGSGDFGAGDALSLPGGVVVTFLDDAEDYQAGDEWEIRVGPRAWYLSEQLDPGTYKFAVKALDAAGNASGYNTLRTVVITEVPGAVTFGAMSLDGTELTTTWSDPDSIDGVRVYSNWDPVHEEFADYVIEETPTATIAGAEQWVFDPGDAEGQLLFYLRPYKATIERPDIVMHLFSYPATAADRGLVLSDPFLLRARAIAAGKIRISWDYRWRDGDKLDSFDLWISSTPIDFSDPPTVNVSATAGAGFPTMEFTYDTPGAYVGLQYVGVRARTAAGVTSLNTDTVTVTPDAAAPSFSGTTYGSSQ